MLGNWFIFNFSYRFRQFGQKLRDFYEGADVSLVSYLEEQLSIDLNTQSDAADHYHKICKLLEEEGSSSVLDNIKLRNNVVEWTCSGCSTKTIDNRGSRVSSFYLLLSDIDHSLIKSLELALSYNRERNCNTCEKLCTHTATKTFDVEHLSLVVANPYKAELFPLLEFELHGRKYDLISVVLHTGSPRGGHYIVVVQDDLGKWIICNDSSIRQITEDEVTQYFKNWTTTQMIYKITKSSSDSHQSEKKLTKSDQTKTSKKLFV